MDANEKSHAEIEAHIDALERANKGEPVPADNIFWLKEQGFVDTLKPHPEGPPEVLRTVTITSSGIEELRKRGRI